MTLRSVVLFARPSRLNIGLPCPLFIRFSNLHRERLYEAHTPCPQSPVKATKEAIAPFANVTGAYRKTVSAVVPVAHATRQKQEPRTQKTARRRDSTLQACRYAPLRVLRHCRLFTGCPQQPLSGRQGCWDQGTLSRHLSALLQSSRDCGLPCRARPVHRHDA